MTRRTRPGPEVDTAEEYAAWDHAMSAEDSTADLRRQADDDARQDGPTRAPLLPIQPIRLYGLCDDCQQPCATDTAFCDPCADKREYHAEMNKEWWAE